MDSHLPVLCWLSSCPCHLLKNPPSVIDMRGQLFTYIFVWNVVDWSIYSLLVPTWLLPFIRWVKPTCTDDIPDVFSLKPVILFYILYMHMLCLPSLTLLFLSFFFFLSSERFHVCYSSATFILRPDIMQIAVFLN